MQNDKSHSREGVLAMVAQVERQGDGITARYAGGEGIPGRFRDFQAFIDQLAQYQLFIDMVETRLDSIARETREAEAKKLIEIRWRMLQMEVEATALFLKRMADNKTPWPMGSQPFLRRRLRRLDDVIDFHTEHGTQYQLASPDATAMQAIRDQVGQQIGSSIALDDFGIVPPEAAQSVQLAPLQPVEEPVPAETEAPLAMMPAPDGSVPALPVSETLVSALPVSATPTQDEGRPDAQVPNKTPAALPSFDVPALGIVAPLAAVQPTVAAQTTAASSTDEPIPDDWVLKVPAAMPPPVKMARKPAAKPEAKPAASKIPRSELRLKVRHDSGYNYIDGPGLAVITEACRVANTTIDELARNLELSRPGLVLILNGRDPVSTELLKTLKRFVVKTGGMIEGQL